MAQRQASKPYLAAFNHGYTYQVTYCGPADIHALNDMAAFYYSAERLQRAFTDGFIIALNELNSGKRKEAAK